MAPVPYPLPFIYVYIKVVPSRKKVRFNSLNNFTHKLEA
jgi:hypothetical protein